MTLIKKIFTNCYIPLIPIFVWNIVLSSKLPSAFDPKSFNRDIPLLILVGENLFRSLIFVLPLLMKINISGIKGKIGVIIYALGTVLYFMSWLMLMYSPNSACSNNALGFIAPAYTPIIWLIGIGLMADSYYFRMKFTKWHFIIPSVAFSAFHITHALLVYLRTH